MFAPPTTLPSLLNPTSLAGHRQPIKPGLGGYLHTLGCSEKVSEHAQSRPAPFTNFFSFFSVSFPPSFTLFHLPPCLYPSFASSFQSPHPVSSSHNRASRNYSVCRSSLQIPNASPIILWILWVFFFAALIMKCAPSQ